MASMSQRKSSTSAPRSSIRSQAHLRWNTTTIFTNPNYSRAARARYLSQKLTAPQLPSPDDHAPLGKTVIRLERTDTFSAARDLHLRYPTDKIAVLNHANAVTPGGGFMAGGRAQEEDLCHCSTLYETLDSSLYPMLPNELIYSPDVLVTKEKVTSGHRDLLRDAWFYVDVISCAAIRQPKTHYEDRTTNDGDTRMQDVYTNDSDRQLMVNKFKYILAAAVQNKVRRLVLGAFGCGVFMNPVGEVARMLKRLLVDQGNSDGPLVDLSRSGLDEVVIAIFDPINHQPTYNAFMNEFRVGDGVHTTLGVAQPVQLHTTIFPPGYAGGVDEAAAQPAASTLVSEEVTTQIG